MHGTVFIFGLHIPWALQFQLISKLTILWPLPWLYDPDDPAGSMVFSKHTLFISIIFLISYCEIGVIHATVNFGFILWLHWNANSKFLWKFTNQHISASVTDKAVNLFAKYFTVVILWKFHEKKLKQFTVTCWCYFECKTFILRLKLLTGLMFLLCVSPFPSETK